MILVSQKLYAAVRKLVERGFVVHPLSKHDDKEDSAGKRPLLKDWAKKTKNTEEELKKYFLDDDCNVGLVCGKASGIVVIDLDSELFLPELVRNCDGMKTLVSRRTAGRAHFYFKYDPAIAGAHFKPLDIDVLSDGFNVVAPPSVHRSGDVYEYNDAPIAEMPAQFKANMRALTEMYDRLIDAIMRCRPCFRAWYNDKGRSAPHDSDGRLWFSAFCLEVAAKMRNLDDDTRREHIKLLAKLCYRKDYDEKRTETEIRGWFSKNESPRKCENLKQNNARFIAAGLCDECAKKKEARGRKSKKMRLWELLADAEFFHDQNNNAYIRTKDGEQYATIPIKSDAMKHFLNDIFLSAFCDIPKAEDVRGVIDMATTRAFRHGEEQFLYNRVGKYENAIMYDIGGREAVRVTAEGWSIVPAPAVFKPEKHQGAQRFTRTKGDITKILDYCNIADDADRLLLMIYIVSCFVPEIAHPVFAPIGHKGSAKSFLFKLMKDLIDPSVSREMAKASMPEEKREMVQQLAHHWWLGYDNLTAIKTWQSDLLCQASTGGSFSKRVLHSDDEDFIYSFYSCVALNGINIVGDRSDLLDRCLIMQLDRIPEDRLIPESELIARYERDKPAIMTGIFDALAKAMAIKPTLKLTKHIRLADFSVWACAIARALGHSEEEFFAAYKIKQQMQTVEAVEANPVGTTILRFMENRLADWEGTPTELYHELRSYAEGHNIDVSTSWPKTPNRLTQAANEIATDLESLGVGVVRCKANKRRLVRLVKKVKEAKEEVKEAAKPECGYCHAQMVPEGDHYLCDTPSCPNYALPTRVATKTEPKAESAPQGEFTIDKRLTDAMIECAGDDAFLGGVFISSIAQHVGRQEEVDASVRRLSDRGVIYTPSRTAARGKYIIHREAYCKYFGEARS